MRKIMIIIAALGLFASPAEAKKRSPKHKPPAAAVQVLSPEEGMQLLYNLAISAAEAKARQALEAEPPNLVRAEEVINRLPAEQKGKWPAVLATLEYSEDEAFVTRLWTEAWQQAKCERARQALSAGRQYLASRHISVPDRIDACKPGDTCESNLACCPNLAPILK